MDSLAPLLTDLIKLNKLSKSKPKLRVRNYLTFPGPPLKTRGRDFLFQASARIGGVAAEYQGEEDSFLLKKLYSNGEIG
ncbi:MAG: hypothetical protein D4R73_10360 [Deltaproteobacteria bacterium]|nr:MAG: hypothetical protein D4R73_10360 [Deltaproteobacteria bacterium]